MRPTQFLEKFLEILNLDALGTKLGNSGMVDFVKINQGPARYSMLQYIGKIQFVIFKPLSYYFEETIGFDVMASFASLPVSRLIIWYNNQAI